MHLYIENVAAGRLFVVFRAYCCCPAVRLVVEFVSVATCRFLVLKTGFGQGLYSAEELDSSLVKAKPAKVQGGSLSPSLSSALSWLQLLSLL